MTMSEPVLGRVAEVTGPRTFTVGERWFDPPPAGRVLVKVERVGICASDLGDWRAGPAPGEPPLRLGHEPVGVVHAVGAGVEGLRAGEVVTGRLVPSFADYVTAVPSDVVVVPDGVDPAVALGEPLGCVVEGYRRAVPAVGASTAVIGLGFMGLVMTQLLARSPTSAVWAADPREDARTTAVALGATGAFAPGTPAPGRADAGEAGGARPGGDLVVEAGGTRSGVDLEAAGAQFGADLVVGVDGAPSGVDLMVRAGGVDLVVEASGTQSGLDLASELVAEHGTLSVLGYHQSRRGVDMSGWNWKALDVVNAHVRDGRRLAEATCSALRLLAAGRLEIGPLLTHHFPLERAGEAYEALENKPEGFHKAVITL